MMMIDLGPVPGWMVIDAVRHAIGRMTYQVGETANWLVYNWSRLPPEVQRIIQRDLEREFYRDDFSRERGNQRHPLGMDMDRREWERVRELWKGANSVAVTVDPGPGR